MNSMKAIVSAVVAGLTVLVVQGGDVLPTWVLLLLAAAIAGLATWATPPGPGLHTPPPAPRGQRRSEGGQFSVERALVIAIFVVLLLVVLGWAFDRL